MFKNVVIGVLALTSIYFAWIAMTLTADPLERAYQRYNHVRLYEDGSFTGEDKDGVKVNGCVSNGLCQD